MTSTSINQRTSSEQTPNAFETLSHLIHTRRSKGSVLPDVPSRDEIETILEAGTWAPSHHQTEAWRFWVLTGSARERLGRAMGAAEVTRLNKAGTPEAETIIERQVGKTLRAPVIIALAAAIPESSPNPVIEDIVSVASAAQNMLLTAHALGLAATWRTGPNCYTPEVRAFFNLSERDQLLGFIYVGYPDPSKPVPQRTRRPVADATTWVTE